MEITDVINHINGDPDLRSAAYEDQRRRRAEGFALESQQPPRRSDRELLLEIVRLREEQTALFNSEDKRRPEGGTDHAAFKAKHDRIREISAAIAKLQRELSGLK